MVARLLLSPHGVLVWHISNKHFDLEPIVGRLALGYGWKSRILRDLNIDPQMVEREGIAPSVWAVLARDENWKIMRTDAAL